MLKMTAKRWIAALVAVVGVLCVAVFLSSKTKTESGRVAEFKKLLEPPISPGHLDKATRLLYAMANEGQTQELVEASGIVESMRLPEPLIWCPLSFVMAVNAANLHREDPQWRWTWIRRGLLECRKGFDVSGNHLDLAHELAFILQLITWFPQPGRLDMEFLARFESDTELQKTLRAPDRRDGEDPPTSPFVMAIGWNNYIKNRILASSDPTGHTTGAGSRLTPEVQDAFIRSHCYSEAMYQWQRKSYGKSVDWLKRAEDQCEIVLRTAPKASPFFKDWRDFYRDLRAIVLLDQQASEPGLLDGERRSLLEDALKKAESLFANAKDQQTRKDLDEGFLQEFIVRGRAILK